MEITLNAGSSDNVNPQLILTEMEKQGTLPQFSICRTAVYNDKLELFK
jgi:hypothetical protein